MINYSQTKFVNGIPVSVGDYEYDIDAIRDFRAIQSLIGESLFEIYGQSAIKIRGLVVSQGAGFTLNITPGVALNAFSVDIPSPSAAWSIPPALTTYDIYVPVRVPQITGMAISGTTNNNATPNYVKLAYNELNGNTRNYTQQSGAYSYEVYPSYTITTTAVAPTIYETALATFITNGSAITFSAQPLGHLPESSVYQTISASTTYPVLTQNCYIACNNSGAATIDVSAGAASLGTELHVVKFGAGVLSLKISNSLTYAIPIGNTSWIWDGTAWQEEGNMVVTTQTIAGTEQIATGGKIYATFAP